jgi:outer membrane receptor for ferrienterochelin and colicins
MACRCLPDNSSRDHMKAWATTNKREMARLVSIAVAQNARAMIGALTLLLAIALLSSTANAQQNNPGQTPAGIANLSLEELMNVKIYTASKHWQKIVDAPASISIVTAEEIQKYGYRSLAEILRSVKGVYIGYDRNYSYIGVRGFSRPGDYNSRVLLLVDGHRLNDNVVDQAYLGTEFPIDVDLIERVEFIRGPGSSLYGASAFFGVINVITKRGDDSNGATVSFEAGSFGTYKGRVSYGADFKNGLEMLVSASFYDSHGQRLFYPEFNAPRTNNGFADNADYDKSLDFLANFSYRDFRLQVVRGSREKGIPTGSFGAVFNDPRNRTVDTDSYVDLGYQHTFSDTLDVVGRLFYDRNNYDGNYVADYAGTGTPPFVENKAFSRGRGWGLELNASKNVEKHRITGGIEYRDNLRQDQGDYDAAPFFSYLDDRRSSKIWALYIQDEFRISEKLIVNAGLRYDRYDTFGGTANPRVALIYKPDEHGSVKLLYGQAFRAPNDFEIFFRSSGFNEPNPLLKPETIKTTELIFERYGKHVRFSVSGFYSDIKGIISQRIDPADGKAQFSNLNNVNSRGVETSIDGKLNNGVEGKLAYTLQRSASEQTGDSLNNSPTHLAKLNLSVPLATRKIFASFQGLYTSERRTLAGSDVSGSFVSNATLLSKSLFKAFDISAGVYNIFNVHYSDPGSQAHLQNTIPQDGRSFRLKLTYSFNGNR